MEELVAGERGRAVVVGGSLSGLFAALLLRRHGWRADIYERVEAELAGRGAGIVTHRLVWDVLDALGIEWRTELGVTVSTRRMFDLDGRVMLEHPCRQTFTAWDRLYAMLRGAFPSQHYHRGRELVRIEEADSRVVAHFADGTAAEGDLLVGADGLRSSVRAQFLPGVMPLYVGYVAWRGLVPESSFPPALHRELFEYLAFCLPTGEQMLGYPVAGPNDDLRVGHRRYNFVWYRPADERALNRLLTDEAGHVHVISIPPPLIAAAVIADMRAAAERVLAPQFRDLIRLAEQPFLQPIYDIESPRMVFGRSVLIGDAAFVARPHVGAGVAKAAQDALTLVESLATGGEIKAALTRFERERTTIGRRIIAHARHLGAYMQPRQATTEERRMAEIHRSPEAVLTETAVLDFLEA
jgi:2-polyprenyl-6-methoxyphenol hydroxylase-like FAD-dependent oxidoreductase